LSYRRFSLVLAAALGLAACATGSAADRWQNRDGRAPSMGESSDCRVQSSRLAAARYPDQIERTSPSGATYRQSNADRFPAEIRLYETCMQAKGYTKLTSS